MVGGFNPSEKSESNGMKTFPIYGKIWKVIKVMFQFHHQPDNIWVNFHFPMVFLWFSYGKKINFWGAATYLTTYI